MRSKDIHSALTDVDERFIKESAPKSSARHRRRILIPVAAACLAVLICSFLVIRAVSGRGASSDPKGAYADPTACADPTPIVSPTVFVTPSASPDPTQSGDPYYPAGEFFVLADAAYPETLGGFSYEVFLEGLRDSGAFGAGSGLAGFYQRTAEEYLLNGGGKSNSVYSPYSIYSALAMLAEISGGNTRAQILGLLGSDSIEELRDQFDRLYRANYRNAPDFAETVPLNGAFFRSGASYKEEAVNHLAEIFRAAAFCGEMGDPEYNEFIRQWLDEATHGMLSDLTGEASKTEPDTVLELISALYFKASWEEGMSGVGERVFHAPGGDKSMEFMSGGTGRWYVFDGYSIVSKALEDESVMWFIIPDEGVELEDVVRSGEALGAVLSDPAGRSPSAVGVKGAVVMPAFDITESFSLIESLQRLGVTDCFDPTAADFSPLCDYAGIFVSKSEHASRIAVDMFGVEASSFTTIGMTYGSPWGAQPPRTFTLDRPFMFVLTSADSTPLFVGTVYDPA